MEIPDHILIKCLDTYMEEYAFGHDMPSYDVLAISESLMADLFELNANTLDQMSKEILAANSPLTRGRDLLDLIRKHNQVAKPSD